jgi:TolB-like protein
MNAQVEVVKQDDATVVMRQVLQQIMGSALFAKAPRARTLLAFLVEKKLDSKEHEITEQAIGLSVFRRDARSYDTALDPVVRVQMGRLRARLSEYEAAQPGGGTCLSIPMGSYIPVLSLPAIVAAPLPKQPVQLMPLRNLTMTQNSHAFVAGVDEELGSQLFATFGGLIQLSQQSLVQPCTASRHRLEGSIRVENNHVRASMRLVDTRAGDVAWLSQFDCNGELGMTLQAELAAVICAQVQRYLGSIWVGGGMLPS